MSGRKGEKSSVTMAAARGGDGKEFKIQTVGPVAALEGVVAQGGNFTRYASPSKSEVKGRVLDFIMKSPWRLNLGYKLSMWSSYSSLKTPFKLQAPSH